MGHVPLEIAREVLNIAVLGVVMALDYQGIAKGESSHEELKKGTF